VPLIIAARDEEFRKWLGPGSYNPSPTACILVADVVVGWVDFDHDPGHDWLAPEEVNIGYFVFAKAPKKGYAARAVDGLPKRVTMETPSFLCGDGAPRPRTLPFASPAGATVSLRSPTEGSRH
jgi:hypothetical protein